MVFSVGYDVCYILLEPSFVSVHRVLQADNEARLGVGVGPEDGN